MSFLQIDHVTKYFPNPSGPGQVCIFKRCHDQDRKRGVRDLHRPFWLWKEHVAQHHCRVGNAHVRAASSSMAVKPAGRGWTGWWSSRTSR